MHTELESCQRKSKSQTGKCPTIGHVEECEQADECHNDSTGGSSSGSSGPGNGERQLTESASTNANEHDESTIHVSDERETGENTDEAHTSNHNGIAEGISDTSNLQKISGIDVDPRRA